jgi:malate/lactate dehydrogenase
MKSTTECPGGLAYKDIRNVAIFGNHSTTQVPYMEDATVKIGDATLPVKSFLTEAEEHEMINQVQTRGAAVIHAQQASSALSAANAIIKHLRDWIFPHDADEVFSMGILSDGNPYGIPGE